MSDCSTSAMEPRDGMHGHVGWVGGLKSAVAFARYVNGDERVAEYFELDGVRFEPVRECRLLPTRDKPRSRTCTLTCSICGWWTESFDNPLRYCPNCGAKASK